MANTQNQWHPFEHRLYRNLKERGIQNRKLLLMVSGGADSMALLVSLLALQSALDLELAVLHCHHGDSRHPEQNEFRNRAEEKLQAFCQAHFVNFYAVKHKSSNESEAELREFRKKSAASFQATLGLEFSVWAHHRDDLIETQILRLIRGVGPQALFEPMQFERNSELRPFLDISREDIQAYLTDKQIEWLEDPSNQNQDYLRNWLRQSWLPALEEKCPGSLKAFSRSLGLLQESHLNPIPSEIWTDEGLNRPLFLTLNETQKKQVLAQYLRRSGKLEFSQNQLKEVMRHLDISQLNHTFKAAQVDWSLTRESIKIASPVVPTI